MQLKQKLETILYDVNEYLAICRLFMMFMLLLGCFIALLAFYSKPTLLNIGMVFLIYVVAHIMLHKIFNREMKLHQHQIYTEIYNLLEYYNKDEIYLDDFYKEMTSLKTHPKDIEHVEAILLGNTGVGR